MAAKYGCAFQFRQSILPKLAHSRKPWNPVCYDNDSAPSEEGIELDAPEKLILGIESSCDETAAAVVADGRRILSSIVSSQIDIHRKYGGVVPELASREHLRQIVPGVREGMAGAGLGFGGVGGRWGGRWASRWCR